MNEENNGFESQPTEEQPLQPQPQPQPQPQQPGPQVQPEQQFGTQPTQPQPQQPGPQPQPQQWAADQNIPAGHRIYQEAQRSGAMGDPYEPQTQPQPAYTYQPEPTQPQPKVDFSYGAASTVPPAGTKASKAKPAKEKGNGGVKSFALGFAGAAVACALAFGGNAVVNNGAVTTTVIGGSGSEITAKDTSTDLAVQVSQKCLPSVVSIDVYTNQSSLMGQYGFMYGGSSSSSESLTKSSLGSGVVLSEDGYIITNYHVVEGSDALKVTIEGNEYDAELVGSDASSDVAVIKAKGASGLTPMDIGDSDDLTVGEWVMSLGSPFGLEQSVATGIISAKSRSQIMGGETDEYGMGGSGEITIYPNMIQTDAAINPGNSGGALVDSQGRLIGINTMITSYSGNYSGVGFAIPVNYAINLAQQIMEGKTPTHAQLGVTLSSVDSNDASRYGFKVDKGAYISSVSPGSGAEKAGIQTGDIVTKFADKKIESASDLMLAVRSQKVGAKVSVVLNRDGEEMTVEVTLGSDEASAKQNKEEQSQEQDSGRGSNDMDLDELEELYNRFFGNGHGGGSQG